MPRKRFAGPASARASLPAMAPKKDSPKPRAASKKSAAKKPEEHHRPEDGGESQTDIEGSRGEVSAMLTALKVTTKDPETNNLRRQLLDIYQNLPRVSEEKKDILSKWKADRSCKWVSSYTSSKFETQSVRHSNVIGHGTKRRS